MSDTAPLLAPPSPGTQDPQASVQDPLAGFSLFGDQPAPQYQQQVAGIPKIGPYDWDPKEAPQSEFNVRAAMGNDRFARAWRLRRMSDIGVERDDLAPADRELLDDYQDRWLREARINFDAATLAAGEMTHIGPIDEGIRLIGSLADGIASKSVETIWGLASLLPGNVPKTMNEAIGLEGIQAPRVGAYLRTLDQLSPFSMTLLPGPAEKRPAPGGLSDTYQAILRGDKQVHDSMPWLTRMAENSATAVGELVAMTGRSPVTAPLSVLMGKAERKFGLMAAAKAAEQWAAKDGAGAAQKLLGKATADWAVPGVRFGLFDGLSNYVDPQTGDYADGSERIGHALVTAATMPIFSAVSAGAAKLAGWISRDGAIVRGAFSRWLSDFSPEARDAIAKRTGGGFPEAWATFVNTGAPGVPPNLLRRAAASVVQRTVEGFGFSLTDAGFWHDGIDAIVKGDKAAFGRFLDSWATNGLTMAMIGFGGGKRALDARAYERMREDMGASLPVEQKPPAEKPAEQAPPDIQKYAPPPQAAPEPTPTPKEKPKPVERKMTAQELETAKFHEYSQLADYAEYEANMLGVRENLAHEKHPQRDAYMAFAARLRRWIDSGFETPKPSFPGGSVPEDIARREQDILDRRSRGRIIEKPPEQPREAPQGAEARAEAHRDANLSQSAAEARSRLSASREGTDAAKQAVINLRNAEIAEARMALDGIGGPTAEEALRIVYDGKEKPRLVTYQDGKYLAKELYSTKGWKTLSDKEVAKLRDKTQPQDPIRDQLEIVDQVAKRAVELEGDLTPEQARFLGAAAHLASRVSREGDAGINAALSMAEQIVPETWSPRHLDVWAQMALRGFSPQVQAELLQHFQVTPFLPPEKPSDKFARKKAYAEKKAAEKKARDEQRALYEQRKANPQRLGEAPPEAAPAEAKPAEAPPEAASEPSAVEIEKASEEDVRATARALGLPEDGRSRQDIEAALRDVGVEAINPEAGHVSAAVPRTVVGTVAGAAALAGLYAAHVPLLPVATIAALPLLGRALYRHWANHVHGRLELYGDPAISRQLQQRFIAAIDKHARLIGEMEPAIAKVMVLAGEQAVDYQKTGRTEAGLSTALPIAGAAVAGPLGFVTGVIGALAATRISLGLKGDQKRIKALKRATQIAQEVKWDGNFGQSNAQRWLNGEEPVPDSMPPEVHEIIRATHQMLVEAGKIANREGMMMTDPKTGRSFTVRFNPEVMRLPRILTHDGIEIFANPNHPGHQILVDAIAKLNGFTIKEAKAALQLMQGRPGYSRAQFETTRQIPKIPDYLKVNGEEVQLYESRPYEIAEAIGSRYLARIAASKTIGQEMPTEATEFLRGEGELGAKLAPNATPEQIATRKLMVDYVRTAKDPEKALKALVAAQRALHGLPLDRAWRGFEPGTVGHAFVRTFAWPARALWIAAKLSTAAVVNMPEVFGTPATFLGQAHIGAAFIRTWVDGLRDPKILRSEARRFEQMGNIVNDFRPRFGGLTVSKRSAANRMGDIARQIEHLAFPMNFVNWMNDIITARAGESVLSQFRELGGKMTKLEAGRWGETLRQLDFSPQEVESFLAGSATKDMELAFLRRLRSYTMGVRAGRSEQGFLQQSRVLRAFVPFQGFVSNNFRMWGRMVKAFSQAITDSTLPAAERFAKISQMMRLVRNKVPTAMAAVGMSLILNYGIHAWKAFVGEDKEATLKNISDKLVSYSIFNEFGAPFLQPLMDVFSKPGQQTKLRDIVRLTMPGNMWGMVEDFFDHKGTYLDRNGRLDIPAKLWNGIIDAVPVLRAIRTWSEDPEMSLAIRRRYELLPPDSNDPPKTTDFNGDMSRAMMELRTMGEDPLGTHSDRMRDLLLHAIDTTLEENPDMSDKDAKKRITSSLASRKILHGIKPEQDDMLRNRMGSLYDKLVEYDAGIDELIKWVRWQ